MFLTKILLPMMLLSTSPFEGTNWKNETHTYQVSLKGEVSGLATHIIKRAKLDGKPIYQFVTINDIKTKQYSFVDTTTLKVNRNDLTPIYSERNFVADKYSMNIKAAYKGNKAKLTLTSTQGNNQLDVDLPKNTFDNDEVLFMLRAYNFAKPETLNFNVLSTSSGKTVPLRVYYVGKEKIRTAKGKKVKTYHLRLDYQGKIADIYYAEKKDHKFIKYVDTNTGLEISFLK